MPGQRDVERSQESQAEVRSSQGAVHWREPAGGRAQQIGEGRQGNQTGNGLLCQHLPISQSPEPKSKQELVEVKGL